MSLHRLIAVVAIIQTLMSSKASIFLYPPFLHSLIGTGSSDRACRTGSPGIQIPAGLPKQLNCEVSSRL